MLSNITIYFATRVRGFFKHLFLAEELNSIIEYNQSSVYELNNWKTKFKNSLGRSKLFDILGIVQIISPDSNDYDIYGSFNRFLNIGKPYFIYVENPTALYHYRLRRKSSLFGSLRINKALQNPNLKALIFMSNACGSTFEQVCGIPHNGCIQKVIYPYVPLNPNINSVDQLLQKSKNKTLNLLFIAQGKRFSAKGGFEVIEAFNALKDEGLNLKLRVITSYNDLSEKSISYLKHQKDLIINDFKFSFEEMQQIYANSHVFLIPSSDDSFNLTVLEAIKSGLPVIGSRLYAIPEMVQDDVNGYLCDPHWRFFDENNIPNPKVWNNRNKTLYSGEISNSIVDFLKEKIRFLYKNRDKLFDLSFASYTKARVVPFSCEYIIRQWNELINTIAMESLN